MRRLSANAGRPAWQSGRSAAESTKLCAECLRRVGSAGIERRILGQFCRSPKEQLVTGFAERVIRNYVTYREMRRLGICCTE